MMMMMMMGTLGFHAGNPIISFPRFRFLSRVGVFHEKAGWGEVRGAEFAEYFESSRICRMKVFFTRQTF